MQLIYRECDSCKKRVLTNLIRGWMHLQPMVGTNEEFIALQETEARDLALGDFCSFVCLSNWASAQEAMRELNELEGEADD